MADFFAARMSWSSVAVTARLQEALVLAKTSRRVIMVCRSPLKAKRDYIEKLAARENVSFVWDSEVSAILGR